MNDGAMQQEPRKVRYSKGLVEKITNTVVFAIPDSEDETEKAEVLESQIVGRLVTLSNMHDSYDQAIDEVQGYLKALIDHYPEETQLIKATADKAGEKFLKIVAVAKQRALQVSIERGDMLLKVKNIRQSKGANNNGQ